MKVKRSWYPTPWCVSRAVQEQLTGREGGAVERAEGIAEACADAIGDLVEMLRDKNVLTDDDVMKLLGGTWELTDE